MPEIFGRIAIPAAVAAEVKRFMLPGWTDVHQPSDTAVIPGITVDLGAGETGAILLAFQLKSSQIILDDRDARTIAESLGLSVIGVPGLLLNAKRLGRPNIISPEQPTPQPAHSRSH